MLKRRFASVLLAVGLVAVATVAVATSLNYSWTNAILNVDGSAIPASGTGSIQTTRIDYGACNAAQDGIQGTPASITVPGAQTAAAVTSGLGPGTWCAHATHINTFGVASDPSNIAVKTIDPPKPKAPTGFTFG